MSTLTYADRQRRDAATSTSVHDRGIEEATEGRLRRRGYLALKDISCTCREEVVTLRGCLPTYYPMIIPLHPARNKFPGRDVPPALLESLLR